ncbi:hypothetical protein BOTNAR_0488g00110 [Botryotinia narcissicola]|uniref:Uncharacterized protein n=1 Tax=Botryotinia narcissicola TaxID=278944 RepID=A0A4Z1HLP4_9HELO|nr:hypothetical protein BOTNAR_0488g00110 [Botryotinia narcissicola]
MIFFPGINLIAMPGSFETEESNNGKSNQWAKVKVIGSINQRDDQNEGTVDTREIWEMTG